MPLTINEIFYSIQGESIHAGIPCIFVRLTGCNLRCAYCDTAYAYDLGIEMKIPEILDQVAGFDCRLIEITGGEPLLQKDTPRLISRLLDAGYHVLIETNGSFDISPIDTRCLKIMDVKCPSSNEENKTDLKNISKLSHKDQVKFVIENRRDYEFAQHITQKECREIPGGNILYSPVSGTLSAARLARWILADHLNVRLHLQLHKIIWPETQRGV